MTTNSRTIAIKKIIKCMYLVQLIHAFLVTIEKKKFMAVVVDTSNDVQHSRAVMAD